MRVLVACEFSGAVRDAFAAKGHDAWSCDLLPSERNGQHIQGDAVQLAYGWKWDLLIAHPPCTYLCNSGVCHLKTDFERHERMKLGAEFFKKLLNAPVKKVVIENPIPHKYALQIIGQKYSQIIQPYRFGHPESKATCLWLRGLPPLMPTRDWKAKMQELPKSQQQRLHYLSPGSERAKERSRTFQGIADAMADQWGSASSDRDWGQLDKADSELRRMEQLCKLTQWRQRDDI